MLCHIYEQAIVSEYNLEARSVASYLKEVEKFIVLSPSSNDFRLFCYEKNGEWEVKKKNLKRFAAVMSCVLLCKKLFKWAQLKIDGITIKMNFPWLLLWSQWWLWIVDASRGKHHKECNSMAKSFSSSSSIFFLTSSFVVYTSMSCVNKREKKKIERNNVIYRMIQSQLKAYLIFAKVSIKSLPKHTTMNAILCSCQSYFINYLSFLTRQHEEWTRALFNVDKKWIYYKRYFYHFFFDPTTTIGWKKNISKDKRMGEQ